MALIHLVRHGEVANPNHVVYADLPGFNLSPRGVLEAHATGLRLSRQHIDVVITSPLQRARQTATAIGRHHGLTPTEVPELVESAFYRGWTGHRWDDVQELFGDQLTQYLDDATQLTAPAESVGELASRASKAVEGAIAPGTATVVAVAHQDTVQAARLLLTGRQLSDLRMDPPPHASITTLESTPNGIWNEIEQWVPRIAIEMDPLFR